MSAQLPQLPEHRISVLLVDDQEMIHEAVKRMLADDPDIDLHYCKDPGQAIPTADRVRPTVILQDLVLPDVDGLMLVRFYRAHPTTADVPIIVLSVREEPLVKAQAFEDGANDYVVKLPDRLELVARIRYHSWGYINHIQRIEAHEALKLNNEKLRRLTRDLHVRNRFIQKTFGRYLSEEVVESLLENPEGLDLGGQKRKVTILMSDLRGFTSSADRLGPEQVLALLNNYLGTMADVILAHGGMVDEFIGDAILAIFGVPVARPDDAERGIACAIAMAEAMAGVNEFNRGQGLPVVEMGIAVHTGEVVVGNIGSEKRTKFGVVGSHVNLTGRIESTTVGGQILVSDAARREVDPDRIQVGRSIEVRAKGFAEPIVAHELLSLAGGRPLAAFAVADDLTELGSTVVQVSLSLLEGKVVDERPLAGRLVALGRRSARIACATPVEPLTDLRLRLTTADGDPVEGDLYAKVMTVDEGCFVACFTSVPPTVETYLSPLAEGGVR